MRQIDSPRDLLDCSRGWRTGQHSIALVPTMGNLHQGHLELVRQARAQADRVIVSIFVNPLQFSADEDFATYPHTPKEDQALLEEVGVDVLFLPQVGDIYPDKKDAASNQTMVSVPGLSDILCGVSRPGHFSGVATIVAKLFHMADPDIAFFGAKDFQQLQVIRQMVSDLDFPIDIVGVPTVREPDGLAMSSRNKYLTHEQRQTAPRLYALLQETGRQLIDDHQTYIQLEDSAKNRLLEYGFRPDYFRILSAKDLSEPVADEKGLVILTAAQLGDARLIDNLVINRS